MERDRKIIKAEILITRRCNLRCGYCNMPADKPEITPYAWCEIFDVLTEQLGCAFYPIYGAEPSLYEGLPIVIEYLSRKNVPYTIITNAVGWSKKRWDYLVSCGLNSITLSMDSVADLDQSTKLRENSANLVLEWALEENLPDIQVQSTVHRQNIGEPILQLIEKLTDLGLWFSFDFIHDNKEDQGYYPRFSKVAKRDDKYAFTLVDTQRIIRFLSQIVDMKRDGYMIYLPNSWWFFLLSSPSTVVKRDWICPDEPAWVSIDSDGTVLVCDDYLLSSGIYAADLPNRWDEFVDFRSYALTKCRGCIWSTHWLADKQLESEWGVDHVTHGRLCS